MAAAPENNNAAAAATNNRGLQTWAPKHRPSDQPDIVFTWPAGETLGKKLENGGLKSNGAVDEQKDGSGSYPLRPYAEDCPFYLRTGACKFGSSCKFNHPVKKIMYQVANKNKDGEGSDISGQIECKVVQPLLTYCYYLTAGGCKYGKSCRFKHSKVEFEVDCPELNFLGLPIRLGARECPFYMRNGSCGYGASCRFNHPDPTTVGGFDPRNSTLNNEAAGPFGLSALYSNCEYVPLHLSGASQPPQALLSSPVMSDSTVPYMDSQLTYVPSGKLLSQGDPQHYQWNGYQAADYSQEKRHLSAAASSFMSNKTEPSMATEEFPERPGQPDCEYFVKTGNCKFKSLCWYHHPKNQETKSEVCVLSEKGLPLRPGQLRASEIKLRENTNILVDLWSGGVPLALVDIYM
ncbi:hypothetical protein RJ640_028054 [Escallonia rubra]|uniref:C3H1-type domain-containing protein n=1 Tax=Escallonia rubra TaxID=112253 RepID=A0AA88QQP4_9ASTE|nr:hypothetical protein RJ640_028054 [Escallonia rubra]